MSEHPISRARVLLLGLILYASPTAFLAVGARWAPALEAQNEWMDRVKEMHRRFWTSFSIVLVATTLTIVFLYSWSDRPLESSFWMRASAVVAALTATLGRGGHAIETWKGCSLVERIDRGMYVFSQIGASVLMLLAFGLDGTGT